MAQVSSAPGPGSRGTQAASGHDEGEVRKTGKALLRTGSTISTLGVVTASAAGLIYQFERPSEGKPKWQFVLGAGVGAAGFGGVLATSALTYRQVALENAGYSISRGPMALSWVLVGLTLGAGAAGAAITFRDGEKSHGMGLTGIGLLFGAGVLEGINGVCRHFYWANKLKNVRTRERPARSSLSVAPFVTLRNDRAAGRGAMMGVNILF